MHLTISYLGSTVALPLRLSDVFENHDRTLGQTRYCTHDLDGSVCLFGADLGEATLYCADCSP